MLIFIIFFILDCVRSPKDKRGRGDIRDSEHRTNHDRGDDKMILHSIKVMSQNSSSRDRKPSHNCQDKVCFNLPNKQEENNFFLCYSVRNVNVLIV